MCDCIRTCVRECVMFINVYLEKLNRPYVTDLIALHYSYQRAHSLFL